jgi:hypothetical protein
MEGPGARGGVGYEGTVGGRNRVDTATRDK